MATALSDAKIDRLPYRSFRASVHFEEYGDASHEPVTIPDDDFFGNPAALVMRGMVPAHAGLCAGS